MVLPSVVNFTHLSAAYLFFHRSCQPLSCHFLAVSESKIIHKCSLLAFSFSDPFTNQNRKSLTVCNTFQPMVAGVLAKSACCVQSISPAKEFAGISFSLVHGWKATRLSPLGSWLATLSLSLMIFAFLLPIVVCVWQAQGFSNTQMPHQQSF